jgi:hypothetical protein
MSTSVGLNILRGVRCVSYRLLRQILLSGLLAFSLSAATIVQSQLTNAGTTGIYQYVVSGFNFSANQPCLSDSLPPGNPAFECFDVLDIEFDPNVFSQISNGVAPAGFEVLLFQPDNPPQAPGDYIAEAMVNQPSLNGTFSVDFALTGNGTPGSQQYSINQFDTAGSFMGAVPLNASGQTVGSTVLPASGAPEPASLSLCGAALIMGSVLWALRGRAGNVR